MRIILLGPPGAGEASDLTRLRQSDARSFVNPPSPLPLTSPLPRGLRSHRSGDHNVHPTLTDAPVRLVTKRPHQRTTCWHGR